jgi:tetratricopeptide (TPR) repeat protein
MALVALIAVAVLALVSALWSPNGGDALVDAARWFALCAVAVAMLAPSGRPVAFSHVVAALAIGAGAAGTIGCLEVVGIELTSDSPGSVTDGFRGTFDNDRFAAVWLAAVAPILVAGAFYTRSVAMRCGLGVALVPMALFVGAIQSWEAAAVALGGTVLAAAWLAIRRGASAFRGLVKPLAAMGVLIAVSVGGVFIADAMVEPNLVQVGGKVIEFQRDMKAAFEKNSAIPVEFGRPNPPRDALGRAHVRATGWQMFTRHAVGGVGAGNWDVAQVRDLDVSTDWYNELLAPNPTIRHADFSALTFIAERGIVGAVLLLLLLGLVLARLWRRSGTENGEDHLEPLVFFALAATLLAHLIAFGLSGLLETTSGAVSFVLVVAMVFSEGDGPTVTLGATEGSSGKLERYGLAGLLPLAVAGLLIYVAVATTTSDYYKARGDVWVRAGALDRSQTAYQQAISWWTNNDEASVSYALVTTTRNLDFAESERSLLAALALRPFDPRLYRAFGQVQVREAVARKKKVRPAIGDLGKNPDPKKMMAALELVDKAVMNAAMLNFTRGIELHPRYIDGRESRANAHLLLQEPGKQQTGLLKTLDKLGDGDRKRAARIHAGLAQSYIQTEDWARSRKHIERSLSLDPEHPRRTSLSDDLALIEARLTGKKQKESLKHKH